MKKQNRGNEQVLPNDLVTEILVRLPVKLLVRFKCVSKWWYGLIKDPIFIENQLKYGSETNRMLLVMNRVLQLNDYVLSFHDLDSVELEEVVCGQKAFFVLCTIIAVDCAILRESKILPPRPAIGRRTPPYDDGVLARGFGITCSGEFKVILIKESYIICKGTWTFPALLYSSSTNSWKRIGDAPHKPYPYSDDGHVLFFNGACHWCASHVILSFNMTTEVFGELESPYGFYNEHVRHAYPLVINNCLAAVRKDNYWESGDLEVWVMKEYGIKESWTIQFVIRPQRNIAPFLSWKNDEWLLFVNRNSPQLACISFLTNAIKSYQIGVWHNTTPLIYEESLVSLN